MLNIHFTFTQQPKQSNPGGFYYDQYSTYI